MSLQTLEAEKNLLSTELERTSGKSQELFEEKCRLSAHLQVDRANFDAMYAFQPLLKIEINNEFLLYCRPPSDIWYGINLFG